MLRKIILPQGGGGGKPPFIDSANCCFDMVGTVDLREGGGGFDRNPGTGNLVEGGSCFDRA